MDYVTNQKSMKIIAEASSEMFFSLDFLRIHSLRLRTFFEYNNL